MSLVEPLCPAGALEQSLNSGWTPRAMAGDASSRRYWRLVDDAGRTAILMDSGSPDGNGFPAFETMSRHLSDLGLIAPRIVHVSCDRCFAVKLTEHMRMNRLDQPALLASLLDVQPRLGRTSPPPGLAVLTPDHGSALVSPMFETAAITVLADLQMEIRSRIGDAMNRSCDAPTSLSLRDFHAENVIWRADETGTNRFGLLDFQDAFIAPGEYDLASLLRDVPRDVSAEAHDLSLARFATLFGKSLSAVSAACATVAVQPNLRIHGIFSRLAEKTGKTRYLAFLLRTARLIREDAAHPALAPLAGPVERLMRHLKT